MTLNLTKEEALHLRYTLRARRRSLMFAKDHRRWHEWPEGAVYAKLCKLLGKKR